MLVIIGSQDKHLSTNISRIVGEVGLRSIRTGQVDRIIQEFKSPERVAIVDMNWEEIQESGVLRQVVNIGRITGNQVIAVCPNQEEDLKKLAKASRVEESFLRYDLETTFKAYLENLSLTKRAEQ